MIPTAHAELERALACIDPDVPRDVWVQVLMGLHAAGAEDLARDWSATGSKWDEPAFDAAWRSFKTAGNGHARVTVATVFHVAAGYGYTPPKCKRVRVKAARATNDAGPMVAVAPAPPATPTTATATTAPVDSPIPDTPFARFVRGTSATGHPYILKKRMDADRLRVVRTWDDRLELAALYVSVGTGALCTVQVIDTTGTHKRNWPGYRLEDGAWRVRGDGVLDGDETVIVAEGCASAWAASQALAGCHAEALACAGQGNLRAVATSLRARYGAALDIVLMSDRDAVATATKAARASAGRVAIFPDDLLPDIPKLDAWDVWDTHGPDALRRVIDAATAPEPEPERGTRMGTTTQLKGATAVLDALRGDEALGDLLGYDLMRSRVVLLKPRPWPDVTPGWSDDDLTHVEVYLATSYGLNATVDAIARACRVLARERAFHPVCQWLDGLQWDGVHRVDSWLVTHCGADDTDYAREVGRVLLLSMVARVRFPGCKVDTMPVLEGRQGSFKSATLAVLGGEWFSDCAPNLEQLRETGEMLRGIWLLENAEITALRRHEVEAQKAFITRRTDSYRPAYGREVIEQPRQCIVVGTTNRLDGYLMDDSGNRRFLPVRVGHCDMEAVTRDRDQLFAEASHRISQGEHWWIEQSELLTAAAEAVEERVTENPWMGHVQKYLDLKKPGDRFTGSDIFSHTTGDTMTAHHGNEGRAIKSALQALGFTGRLIGGRVWYEKQG